MIELTEEQRRALKIELTDEQRYWLGRGTALRYVDGSNNTAYVVVRADKYERMLESYRPIPEPLLEIAPGILRSQAALRRDLPQLLENKKLRGKCICYHGDERIGIADDMDDLLRECLRRGLPRDEYYIGVIEWTQLIEEEEIEL
jgi:hypothetical protein